uniref:Tyrosine-protein phosphatase domain-containing protein n=1 Tax=Heterorhabditis bacteriophora TaxID=37862 RepID=A0A1I7XSD3_HETBA
MKMADIASLYTASQEMREVQLDFKIDSSETPHNSIRRSPPLDIPEIRFPELSDSTMPLDSFMTSTNNSPLSDFLLEINNTSTPDSTLSNNSAIAVDILQSSSTVVRMTPSVETSFSRRPHFDFMPHFEHNAYDFMVPEGSNEIINGFDSIFRKLGILVMHINCNYKNSNQVNLKATNTGL